ncbi:hypothetical protein KIN20_020426 [Parelaphostrongylus tenuis]|uniref:Uncharacterized protein n=1 Tax=Parelaphostrongylus tenuis TaxID=148309 RepID=A0AAD5QVI9_PARTN|nr:hypothetical protein KIN20_020426 [Parelaphostrongylus tenuis]
MLNGDYGQVDTVSSYAEIFFQSCTYNAGVLSMARISFSRTSGLYVAPSQLRCWELDSVVAFEELTPLLKFLFN